MKFIVGILQIVLKTDAYIFYFITTKYSQEAVKNHNILSSIFFLLSLILKSAIINLIFIQSEIFTNITMHAHVLDLRAYEILFSPLKNEVEKS